MGTPTGQRRQAYGAYHFKVQIKEIGAEWYFRSVSGLKSEAEVVPMQEGGLNSTEHKLIGRTKCPNLVLKQGFAGPELWQLRASFIDEDAPIQRFNGSIIQLGPGGQPAFQWDFQGGWICKWEGPEFDASKNEVSVETIEIAHEGLVYPKGGAGK